VVPQTKQMKTNIARCDVVDEAFIGGGDMLLPRRNDSASGWVGAAPKRHGAYACGRAVLLRRSLHLVMGVAASLCSSQ
jgi:hypothetical protein